MRTRLVAGNWKMNGDTASIATLIGELLLDSRAQTGGMKQCQMMVLPPFGYLDYVGREIGDSALLMGAQDVDQRSSGAVTGGVSAGMVKDLGCDYALVGHSERRSLFGDTDEIVAEKFAQCIANNLIPILCVGETLEQRRSAQTLEVVTAQLQAVMMSAGAAAFSGSLVAYEPVWAIGTGESATPEQAEEVHAGLRQCLAETSGTLADETSILYGGSVTAENAKSLFAKDNVDGALVGGASLKADSFLRICAAAEAM